VAPYSVAAKNHPFGQLCAVSKSCAKAFKKQKNSRSAAQKQSIESGLGMPWYRPEPG
jgi:hypothetical protein